MVSRTEWLELFCAQGVGPGNLTLHPLEKVWIALARLDGNCGELLGQAASSRHCLDRIRSWICCLMTFSQNAVLDSSLPRCRTDLETCIRELQDLVSTYPRDLANDSSIQFVSGSLLALSSRLESIRETSGAIAGSYYSGISRRDIEMATPSSSQGSYGTDTPSGLSSCGCLISLHNGHNGWPDAGDISAFCELLRKSGLDIHLSGSSSSSSSGTKKH